MIRKQTIKLKIIMFAVFAASFVFVAFGAIASEIKPDSVIKLVNQARVSEGLGQLKMNYNLNLVAEAKARDMLENDYFAHTSPVGITPWYWFEKNGYEYKFAGENLAISFSSAESQHKAWMNSSKHRKNILNLNYQEIGVAVRKGIIQGDKTTIVVQVFGARDKIETAALIGASSELYKKSIMFSGSAKVAGIQKVAKLQPMGSMSFRMPVQGRYNQNFWESLTQTAVMSILFLVIAINTILLQSARHSNPFMAVNSVIMLIFLTTLVF